MTQEDKELLLQDLCARLSYGIKILHTGWDCDSDTDFDTIETLIGIDDKFIYTVWDKTGDREKHCLSVSNWKPYLRPMSSMTEEEWADYQKIRMIDWVNGDINGTFINAGLIVDWLNKNHFDYRGLIPKDLAIEVTEENNPYKGR
jgi:hypothetical protein